MSDMVASALIAGSVTLLGSIQTIILAWMQNRTRGAVDHNTEITTAFAVKAEKKVEEVRVAAMATAGKGEEDKWSAEFAASKVKIAADVIASKVEEVKQTAEVAASKVEEVKIAADVIASKVETVRQMAQDASMTSSNASANVKNLRESMLDHGIKCKPHIEDEK